MHRQARMNLGRLARQSGPRLLCRGWYHVSTSTRMLRAPCSPPRKPSSPDTQAMDFGSAVQYLAEDEDSLNLFLCKIANGKARSHFH